MEQILVIGANEYQRLLEQAAKASMFKDTLNYIAGESHLTVDTLDEARSAALGVLEEAGEFT